MISIGISINQIRVRLGFTLICSSSVVLERSHIEDDRTPAAVLVLRDRIRLLDDIQLFLQAEIIKAMLSHACGGVLLDSELSQGSTFFPKWRVSQSLHRIGTPGDFVQVGLEDRCQVGLCQLCNCRQEVVYRVRAGFVIVVFKVALHALFDDGSELCRGPFCQWGSPLDSPSEISGLSVRSIHDPVVIEMVEERPGQIVLGVGQSRAMM